jgi:hypothetical protein
MFVQILNKVTEQTNRECQGSRYVRDYLTHAIGIWCNELKISPDITDCIRRGYDQYGINELTNYIYQKWEPKQEEEINWVGQKKVNFKTSEFYNLVALNIIKGRNENMKLIVFIAFGITVIGYFIYILNQQKQQQTTRREEPRQYNPNLPAPSVYTVQTPPIQTTPVQTITKQFLVLVVSASQEDFLKSLESKGCINVNDGEALYQMTKYLWLGSKTEFSQIKPNINQYSVSKAEESEYDICLVYIELKQADKGKGFEPNVNQLDRYDAFRSLADLAGNFEVSPRFRMEAYENIDVYNR